MNCSGCAKSTVDVKCEVGPRLESGQYSRSTNNGFDTINAVSHHNVTLIRTIQFTAGQFPPDVGDVKRSPEACKFP